MKKVYLDNNIIIYIENETLELDYLNKLINSKPNKYFFSAAHLQETEEIKSNDVNKRNSWIRKRLKVIEEITNCNYLYHKLPENVVYELNEKPTKVLETIREVTFANKTMKSFVNFISNEQKKQIREVLGLDSGKMNNYEPEEVIEHLNKKLNNLGTGQSFLELIEQGISFNPQGKEFGLHNRIAGIFELLDMLGYWTDRYNEKSNYARLWDSNHTYFAAFCDYFISDDKRTRNKAKVVYAIYNIKTKVISSKENK